MGIVTAGDRATEEADYGETEERQGERVGEKERDRERGRGERKRESGRAAATAFRSAPRLVSTIDFPRFFSTRREGERGE